MECIKIAENKAYSILVFPEENRVYLKIFGFWRNPEAVPNYLSDWRRALSYLKRGFTLLTDASDMKTHPADVRKMHEEAQAIVIKAGVRRVAEVVKDDVASMQLDSLAKTTQFPKKSFTNIEAANEWLNELQLVA